MFPRYVTEPDFFRHERPERLVCERIEIEGRRQQRAVLNVPISKLRPFKYYEIVIRQPIPQDARALPLYIKGIADVDFFPNVSTGFGVNDEAHGLWDDRGNWFKEGGCFEEAHAHGDTIHGEGMEELDRCPTPVEVITERVEAKMFSVHIWGSGNVAFANNLVFSNTEPYPFIPLYLNDSNQFMLRMPFRRAERHRPRRLVRRREIIVREPVHAETLGIGRQVTEFVHPSKHETFDTWVEGSCGHRPHGEYGRGRW